MIELKIGMNDSEREVTNAIQAARVALLIIMRNMPEQARAGTDTYLIDRHLTFLEAKVQTKIQERASNEN